VIIRANAICPLDRFLNVGVDVTKRKQKKQSSATLPNAPLAEVVFEFKWMMEGDIAAPDPFKIDPGYPVLVKEFRPVARKLGFPICKEIGPLHQIAAGTAHVRYFKTADDFPLLQLGPGVFAYNQSSAYDWKSFKAAVLTAMKAFLGCYPNNRHFPLAPRWLELRYINLFDEGLLGTDSYFTFASKATNLQVGLPQQFPFSDLFESQTDGRLQATFFQKGKTNTRFFIDFGSAEKEGSRVLRLESKVRAKGKDIPKISDHTKFIKNLGAWLDEAHDITSPFFKAFLRESTLKKFQ